MKKVLLVLILLIAMAWAAVSFLKQAEPLPEGSQSAAILNKTPHFVGHASFTLEDTSRPTQANGKKFDGASSRILKTNIWYPSSKEQPTKISGKEHPLIIYSHGFSSDKTEGTHIAELLASHGYIVMAPDFPLTTMFAPGDGPAIQDVVNQPGDVSFLIDTMLQWNINQNHQFSNAINPGKIGVAGLSLGGLTSTLVAFHPAMADQRVQASISIAGPSVMFGPRFFQHRSTPFMMIAGTADSLVTYQSNAKDIRQRSPNTVLVSLDKGSHTGFAYRSGIMRFMKNPDAIGCYIVKKSVDDRADTWDGLLGGEKEGIIAVTKNDLCIQDPLPKAMNPLRQQLLTKLIVLEFFESIFNNNLQERQKASRYLYDTMPVELHDVTISY